MQERSKYRIKWFNFVFVLMIGVFTYFCVKQQMQLNEVNRETEAVRVQLAQIQQLNNALNEERDALSDRRYIEKLAREELGLVKPGEMPYFVAEKK